MKNKFTSLISLIIWSAVAIIASLVLLNYMNGSNFFRNLPDFTSDFQLTKTMDIVLYDKTINTPIEDITIDFHSGGVQIYPSQDNMIHVIERSSVKISEDKWATIKQNGPALNIAGRKFYGFYIFNLALWNTPGSILEVHLPQATYASLKMQLTAGANSVQDIDFSEIDIELTSGEMILQNSTISKLSLEMTSGQSDLSGLTIENASFESISGDLNFKGTISHELSSEMTSGQQQFDLANIAPTKMTISLTSGSAYINLPSNDGFTVDLEKTAGQFNADFEHMQTNDRYIYKQGTNRYQAEITSGELTIHCQ
ncbi:MAG: DUF4097 family beta strand repeat-containing protein [Eubacteriales bacterium]|nr:DUF4097 family beta strand repeat-containing protein [Eubacteriales bacterium]